MIDNDFGSQTQKAVKDFQWLYGLVPDGIVGPKTAQALENLAYVSSMPTGVPTNYPPSFNPQVAADWAVANPTAWVPDRNDPCAEFASLALSAGGLPDETDQWYRPDAVAVYSGSLTYASINANGLYLLNRQF